MARLPRLAIAGLPHHIIARGRDGQAIFVEDDDRRAYLLILREVARDCAVAIHAYALFDREVRLLVTPERREDLSRLMHRLACRYVARFNVRHARSGALWEARYKATVLEPERYLLSGMNCVEHEAVRQGIVEREEDYRWSSAAHHRGVAVDPAIVEHALYWSLGNTPFEREAAYRALSPYGDRDAEKIQMATVKGWALGSAGFMFSYAAQAKRRLNQIPRGRPARRT